MARISKLSSEHQKISSIRIIRLHQQHESSFDHVHLAWLVLLAMPEDPGLLPLASPVFSTNVALGGGPSPL
jgi:hypothetical protein